MLNYTQHLSIRVDRAVGSPAKRRIEPGKRPRKRRSTLKDANPEPNLLTVARPELYIVRRKGTVGVNHALRRKLGSDENMACVYLFETSLDAVKYLKFARIDDPDRWDVVSSEEFGGVIPLLKKASSIATHVVVNPPLEYVRVPTPTIKQAINIFESLAEKSNSGGPKTPFWFLTKRVGNGGAGVLLLNTEPGVVSVCLFKTEMDAEEARHSWPGAYTWESDGPADPNHAVAALKELSSQGCSHALINPPPSGTSRLPQPVPIGDVIDHIKSKGQIRDLA